MKITVQEYADRIVAAEYRQPVKTILECLAINGWDDTDKPVCCGQLLTVAAFIGQPYIAACQRCGKFAINVVGPHFTGDSAVQFVDPEKVDIETDRTWIAGVGPVDPTLT